MKLTLEVSSTDEARQAMEVLLRYMELKPAQEATGVSLSRLQLSTRAHNCLRSEGIRTVEQLVERTPRELLLMPHFGQGSLDEVRASLAGMGLALREDERA